MVRKHISRAEMLEASAKKSHEELQEMRDILMHHGVLGMKWGVRRYQPYYPRDGQQGKGKYSGEMARKAKAATSKKKSELTKGQKRILDAKVNLRTVATGTKVKESKVKEKAKLKAEAKNVKNKAKSEAKEARIRASVEDARSALMAQKKATLEKLQKPSVQNNPVNKARLESSAKALTKEIGSMDAWLKERDITLKKAKAATSKKKSELTKGQKRILDAKVNLRTVATGTKVKESKVKEKAKLKAEAKNVKNKAKSEAKEARIRASVEDARSALMAQKKATLEKLQKPSVQNNPVNKARLESSAKALTKEIGSMDAWLKERDITLKKAKAATSKKKKP